MTRRREKATAAGKRRSPARKAAKSSRAKASTALRHGEHHDELLPALQLIYDTAPVGLAFLTPNGRYVRINRHLTEICGISVADHIGRTVRETVPQVADQVEKIVQAVVRTGTPVTGVEVHGQRVDKGNADHVWVTNWHPLKGADGSVVGVNVVAEDVTERIRAEKALRELNETLEQRVAAETRERLRVWNVSQDLLLVADPEGTCLSVNPAWTATLGWSEAELVGTTWRRLIHPEDVERTRAELQQLAGGEKALRFETRLRHKAGSHRWLSWHAASDGGRIYAMGRDVTELKEAEIELREARRELARVAGRTIVAAMTASIAHEIKQPLAAIVTHASAGLALLDAPNADLDEARAALGDVIADGLRASEVIQSLRAMFSKDEQPGTRLDANDLIRQTLAIARAELDGARVVVELDLSKEAVALHGHRGQLQQLILNLLANAADAMRSVEERPRLLRVKSEVVAAESVAISVADSGTGIDPASIERIFDAFFSTKTDGMGMGLAICRSIVETHGGTLSVSQGEPHGSTFRVVLPRCNAPIHRDRVE